MLQIARYALAHIYEVQKSSAQWKTYPDERQKENVNLTLK